MNKLIVALAVVMLLAVGVAGAATTDQGRRLAGPFCVGKTFLKPLDGGRTNGSITLKAAILRAGVVRSVANTQPCRPWENRRVGLAIPDPDPVTPGPAGPAGPAGANGANGATGPAGPAGPKGDAGPAGPKGATGDKGATGASGPAGPPGMNGKDGMNGHDGKDGQDGKDGLGNDTIKVCVRDDGLLQIVSDYPTTTTVSTYGKDGGGDQHRCVKTLTLVIVK